jgi:hypothetical protein
MATLEAGKWYTISYMVMLAKPKKVGLLDLIHEQYKTGDYEVCNVSVTEVGASPTSYIPRKRGWRKALRRKQQGRMV